MPQNKNRNLTSSRYYSRAAVRHDPERPSLRAGTREVKIGRTACRRGTIGSFAGLKLLPLIPAAPSPLTLSPPHHPPRNCTVRTTSPDCCTCVPVFLELSAGCQLQQAYTSAFFLETQAGLSAILSLLSQHLHLPSQLAALGGWPLGAPPPNTPPHPPAKTGTCCT